jgi:hypothetical protein
MDKAMKRNDPTEDDAIDDLIGHAMGLVDPPKVRLFAASESPDYVPSICPERLSGVRANLSKLLDDGYEPCCSTRLSPPVDLMKRTCARIREHDHIVLEFREEPAHQPHWRVADFAVAAAVLFAAFLGSLPALKNNRSTMANLACSSNLAQIWKGVEQYSTTFNVYPNATAQNQRLPVGATLALLRHTGHLDDLVLLTCPGCSSTVKAHQLPQWQHLQNDPDALLRDFATMMSEVYAMHPGIQGQLGVEYLERSMLDPVRAMVPLLGDRPPMQNGQCSGYGNSPSHGGFGQNIIFADGHSLFIRGRSIRSVDNDIYVNRHGRSGAAVDPLDIILVPAGSYPNSD